MKRSADVKPCGIVVAALALAGAGAAFASEPVPTADPAGAPAASTADQIEQFIKASPVPDLSKDGVAGVTTTGPRDRSVLGTVHGFVEVGVGTGGYRSVSGLAVMPLGDNGALAISAGETRGRGYYGDWRSRNLGASLALGPTAQTAGRGPACPQPDGWDMMGRTTWVPLDAVATAGCRRAP